MNNIKNFYLILLLLFFACNNPTPKTNQSLPNTIAIQRGGVQIAYADTKVGDTTLMFIHGWNINKEYWQHQVDYFSKTYRVVTVDLPGFGASGHNRNTWTVEEYGKDISAVLAQLDLKKVVVIGHSMSGAIVVETALQNPDRVIGVVGVDNFTNVGAEMPPSIKKQIEEAYVALRKNYTTVVQQFAAESLFSPSTDSMVKARVLNDFYRVDTVLSVNILEQNDSYPLDEKLRSLGKTIYLINSSFHPTDTTGFKKYNIPFQLYLVGPTGHYPLIEAPELFNVQMQRVMANLARP